MPYFLDTGDEGLQDIRFVQVARVSDGPVKGLFLLGLITLADGQLGNEVGDLAGFSQFPPAAEEDSRAGVEGEDSGDLGMMLLEGGQQILIKHPDSLLTLGSVRKGVHLVRSS